MSTPMELNIYALWGGKQTAKGTPLAAASMTHRFQQIGGAFQAPQDIASQEYSDMSEYGAANDWINTLVGSGNPQVEATPEELAWLLWAHHGGETATAVTGPPAKTKHSFSPIAGLGHWVGFYARQGVSQIRRTRWNDCQVGQLVIEGSTGQKDLRVTPTIVCLDPAEIQATDPTQAVPTKVPFLYSDGASQWTVDGTVFRGHSAFQLTLNKDLQAIYGDDIPVYDVMVGNPGVQVQCTFYFDADGVAQWNKLLYGTAAPAPGAKPLKALPALGSYAFYLKSKDATGALNGDEFHTIIPGVRWNLPDAPGPNPGGGVAEVQLTGNMRPVAGVYYTIDVNNDAAAFTV